MKVNEPWYIIVKLKKYDYLSIERDISVHYKSTPIRNVIRTILQL